MDNQHKQVRSLHLWTTGDSSAGIAGQSAEVAAPEFLISSEGIDIGEFNALLAEFKQKMVEAFEVIWDEKPSALFDFELEPRLNDQVCE